MGGSKNRKLGLKSIFPPTPPLPGVYSYRANTFTFRILSRVEAQNSFSPYHFCCGIEDAFKMLSKLAVNITSIFKASSTLGKMNITAV